LKIIFGALLIALFLGLTSGDYHPSFASVSGFDSYSLVDIVDGAMNYCGNTAESLVGMYQDFMASSRTVYFFNHCLPSDQNPGRALLLGLGLVGLAGFGRRRLKK